MLSESLRVFRKCSRLRLGLGNVCLKRTSLCLRGTPDLVDVRITVTDVMSQAPSSRMECRVGLGDFTPGRSRNRT